MAQTSEAACLLQTGRAYPHRIGFRDPSGAETFVGLRPEGFSVYHDDAPIYHFDLDGRWLRAFVGKTHYLKGLDGSVRAVERPRVEGSLVLQRRTLAYAEASDLDAQIRDAAIELLADVESTRQVVLTPPETAQPIPLSDLAALLERVATWDAAAWFAQRERYAATYGPLPFLPPDLPNPIMLQKTLGHIGGRAFGGANPAAHHVRTPSEFADHARAVRDLVGRRIAQGKTFFLAGADALRLPAEATLDALATIQTTFADGPGTEVHAFLDDFSSGLPDQNAWAAFARSGLRKVTLGIVSGDDTVKAKDGLLYNVFDVNSLVELLKANEVAVGWVVLVGSGGLPRSRDHVEQTVALFKSLPLDRKHLVTLVDRRLVEAVPDEDRLDDAATAEQMAELRRRISGDGASNGPRVIPYNPDKRWA